MKSFIGVFLTCCLTLTAASAVLPQEIERVRIPAGTVIDIELTTAVSSEQYQEGSIIGFTVVRPVMVEGITVVKKGATAKARVVKANKAGRWGKGGNVAWQMQDVEAVDGSIIPVQFEDRSKGNTARSTVIAGTMVTSFFFGPVGLLWGLKKGKEVTIPAGKRFEVTVPRETTLHLEMTGETDQPKPNAVTRPAVSEIREEKPVRVYQRPKRRCIENGVYVPCP